MTDVPSSPEGAELIAAERQRQIEVEGWEAEYIDGSELRLAALSYLRRVDSNHRHGPPPFEWPWHRSWWKPSNDPIRNLVKAGALIAAEIDRLQRLKEHSDD